MTDFKFPDLPSDDELGITDEDKEKFEDEPPELTEEERRALGLEEPPRPSKPPPATPPPPGAKPPKPKKEPRPPRPPEGPRSRWRGPVTLAVLAVAAFLSSSYRTLPAPAPANAPDTTFSSARAMAMNVEIARRAHPTGSPAHAEVREYILARLSELGLEPEVQTTTALIGRGTRARAATVRNIVARVPGTGSTGAIVLLSHYDGAGIALAAADDGAGVVSTLEALRALSAGGPLRNDLIVLITDAEELGLLGAQAFVDEHPWMADVSLVLNVEMRGGGGPSVMFETGAENGWIVGAMKDAGIPAWANSLTYEVYRRLPNDTDFTRFREAGKQGLNFAAIGRASVYHQTYDSPANLSEATLQHHGENLLGMVRFLGAAPLATVDAPDLTYFSLPLVGLVTYPTSLVLPIAAWMLLLAVVVLFAVVRAGARWPGLLVGLGLGVVAAGLTGAAGYGLLRWLPRFHPEYGALVGSTFHHEGWYVLALTGAALFFVTALFGLARRWFTPAILAWGALLLPLGGAAYLTFAMPAGAMDLQWPVVAAHFGVAALLLARGRRTGMLAWLLTLALALPVVAFMQPLTEQLWLGLSFAAAMPLGVLITVAFLLLLPALDWLREPNSWWAPTAALVFGAACLGLGIRAAEPTPERPAPSTLLWSLDRESGEARWITLDDDDGYAPAEAWAEARVGAAFADSASLRPFGFDRTGHAAAAEPVDVAPLEVTVVTDSTADGTRHVRLALRSAIGAETMQFRFPEGGATRAVALNGQPLPIEGDATLVEHWGEPDPVVLLDLEMPAGTTVAMDVVEHLLRPGELVGAEHFQRPPTLAANVAWQSDRALVRTPASSFDLRYGGVPAPPPPSDTIGAGQRTEAPDPVGDTVPSPDTTTAPDTVPASPPDTTPAPDTLPAATHPVRIRR